MSNGAIVVSALFGAITIIRLGVASDGSTQTARAIVRYGDTKTIVLNAVIDLLPSMIYVALLAVVTSHRRRRLAIPRRVVLFMITFMPFLLLVLPYAMLAALLITEVVPWLRAHRREKEGKGADSYIGSDVGVVAVVIVVSVLLSRHMWLPSEVIAASNGRSVVGFTLSETAERLVVLKDEPREILILPGHGARRTPCRLADDADTKSWYLRTLADLFRSGDRPDYPKCSEAVSSASRLSASTFRSVGPR